MSQLPENHTYGLMSLSLSPESFISQIASQYNVMSYCLANQVYDATTRGWMSFGNQHSKNLSSTSFFGNDDFFVNLKGITIDGIAIDVSDITTLSYDPNFNGFGGLWLDTGSTATYLQEPLHSRFLDVFIASMKRRTNIYPDSYPDSNSDVNGLTCYSFKSDVNISSVEVPQVTIHLEDDVDLHLEIENLFGIIDVDSENNQRTCLMFVEDKIFVGGDFIGPRILGGITQQSFHIEIDIKEKKIGFARTKCI
ncbi:hypothetical protein KC19_6G082100 [Ceratodon purpureus]|uniref:Peptidase A1 domain-containing protein n=1 Tax=Ceratodon purpureus TaxID=3225 RepID=A0A8T0HFP9_CERPU|nr:hypothetical protein KC19_6G082100 [Ceratodon purpureus]